MKVELNTLNTNVSNISQNVRKVPNFTSGDVETEKKVDEFIAPEPIKSEKKGIKNGFAGIWKFFAKFDTMTGSVLKGLFYGLLTGFGFMGGAWLFKTLPSAFSKEGPKLIDVIKHPFKSASKPTKILAAVAGGIVLGVNLIKGIFSSNQKTAVIDHKLKTGHRNA